MKSMLFKVKKVMLNLTTAKWAEPGTAWKRLRIKTLNINCGKARGKKKKKSLKGKNPTKQKKT